jgi:hypothetical protein
MSGVEELMKLRSVLLGSLLVSQAACMQRAIARPDYLVNNRPRSRTVVTMNNGDRLPVSGVEVVADTIFGRADNGDDVAVPIGDVKLVEYRKLSPGRTAMVVGAGVVGLGAAVAFAAAQGTPCVQIEKIDAVGSRYYVCAP